MTVSIYLSGDGECVSLSGHSQCVGLHLSDDGEYVGICQVTVSIYLSDDGENVDCRYLSGDGG